MRNNVTYILLVIASLFQKAGAAADTTQWIRINQLGYMPRGIKAAIWGSMDSQSVKAFQLIDASSHNIVMSKKAGKHFGRYGPFSQTCRLDFSSFYNKGRYYIKAGKAISPVFTISDDVYKGTADFCLRYMRQQQSGFNPYLKDSCHTHDGFTMYAPVPDGTHIYVAGGWHDASDYLQYSTTTANATYHLLAAWRDFPKIFSDIKQASGLDGSNGIADVLDEAKWGLDWLLRMHPKDDWMFNQLGDDRDHRGMRIPKEDTNFYDHGLERPVYFCSGLPQVRGKLMNNTTGVASTAGKFSSAFALGSEVFFDINKNYAARLTERSGTAMRMGINKPGACQTASVLSPYIYAEDNWTDDMELAAAAQYSLQKKISKKDGTGLPETGLFSRSALLTSSYSYALKEPVTPWLGNDTAKHYQWYPFINVGHYELSKILKDKRRDTIIQFYKEGIERVWNKARQNAFYRGTPFIWCSNNLTVAFAIQCYWYRQLSGDDRYIHLEESCFDWIFGCNPWGTSMVYGLPEWGDTPVDPHSAFTHLKNYPIDGGLIDGPVSTNIYKSLIGISLHDPDEYKLFQSDLAVYHDDYGDYSTNEPTMDGTAVLIYLLAAHEAAAKAQSKYSLSHGGIIRGDSTKKVISLVFTGDEFGDGLTGIVKTLQHENVKGSFFFTGRFYRNVSFQPIIKQLYKSGHYLGPHSNDHLLYCDWTNRDSLLVTHELFDEDLKKNIDAIGALDFDISKMQYFIPPYEWWNDSIAAWAERKDMQIINFTPGIITNADYTYPEMGASYKSSETLIGSLKQFEKKDPQGLNGAIILIHAGTDPRRKDKLYNRLNELIRYLKTKGYRFSRVDSLL